jgi:hypothetical protein
MSERADRNPKTIKIPGPDHPITIEHNKQRLAFVLDYTNVEVRT